MILQDDIQRKQRRAQGADKDGAAAKGKDGKDGKDAEGSEKVDLVPPEEALETVAVGVVLRGVLSVLDEGGYRRACVTAGTGIDPVEGVGGPDGAGREERRSRRKERAVRRSMEGMGK